MILSDRTPWLQLAESRVGFDLPLDRPAAFRSAIERFAGMATVKVDLLLVADAEALAAARADLAGNALTTIKKAIRRGNIMFFVFKNKAQLQDAGYEDFLESLGLAFLGACR